MAFANGLEAAIKKAVETAIVKAAFDMEAHAVRIVPVDTGRLKASIRAVSSPNQIIISSNTDYDVFVEFGTVKMRAQPFIRPAVHLGVKRFIPRRIVQEIRKINQTH